MKTKLFLIPVTLLMAVGMLSFPIRDLAADYHYRQVTGILDDETTEGLDVSPISEKSMPAYLAAIDSLKKAASIIPSRALYQSALAELYARLGKWADVMQSLGATLPASALSPQYAVEKALFHRLQAVALEPTNPDNHLALGQFYDTALRDPELAARELKVAERAFPLNTPLRYALAMHYLISGKKGDALEQARVLAEIDDSYILKESFQKADFLERQPQGYISMLKRSYLYAALEIAWKVSADIEVVKGIAPDTRDAAPVVQLFISRAGDGG